MTHVTWCMPGSLTSDFLCSRWRENVPGIPGARAASNFAYLVRGPWCEISTGHVFGYGSSSDVKIHFWSRDDFIKAFFQNYGAVTPKRRDVFLAAVAHHGSVSSVNLGHVRTVSANKRRRYKGNVFSPWLKSLHMTWENRFEKWTHHISMA